MDLYYISDNSHKKRNHQHPKALLITNLYKNCQYNLAGTRMNSLDPCMQSLHAYQKFQSSTTTTTKKQKERPQGPVNIATASMAVSWVSGVGEKAFDCSSGVDCDDVGDHGIRCSDGCPGSEECGCSDSIETFSSMSTVSDLKTTQLI